MLILVLAAIAASQVWIWTAKRPATGELAAIVDTHSRDPLGVRVRYLFEPDRDDIVLATESSEGALRVYISPGLNDRGLKYPNVAGQGVFLGEPLELPSRGGLTARLEIDAPDSNQVSLAVRLEYGDGTSERILLTPMPIPIDYDEYLFGEVIGRTAYTRYVPPPETRLLIASEGLGAFLIAVLWIAIRMFRDSGVIDRKRQDRRFYPVRWMKWRS